MDTVLLGRRISQARESAGMTQEALGRELDLDRTAITRIEHGERRVGATELIRIAEVLSRPLTFFTRAQVAAVVSRRAAASVAHESTTTLDDELEQFALDIVRLSESGLLASAERSEDARVPRTHAAAESAAGKARARLQLGSAPLTDLGAACERLGLLTYSAPLGSHGPDGGCVVVDGERAGFGAAVVNGDRPAGRRRMTLAHELGHWLFGDAYDSSAALSSERMIDSFAIHFLAPRAGVHALWSSRPTWTMRDRAMLIGAEYRLSWSATVGQLKNVGLIDREEHSALSRAEPRHGDYVRLQLTWPDELSSAYLSPSFAAACVSAYVDGRLTAARAVEMLRGTLSEDALPARAPIRLEDYRAAFADHGE